MSDYIKILGQLSPSANTLSSLYVVPISASTTISSIFIANTTAISTSFRASVAFTGETDSVKQYLYYDVSLPANDTFVATVGITMSQNDVFRVYAGISGISFNLFGVEIL